MRSFAVAISLSSLLLTGCYVLQPVSGQPLPLGAQVGLSVNDAGRVAIGGSMGPEVSAIEGRLVAKDSTEYVVAVSLVRLLRGGEQVWSGERVRIKTEHVTGVSERKLSRGRTAAMVGVSVGALIAIARSSLLGSLGGDEGRLPPDSGQTTRIPRY
ncbi:MAG: hypothetical protein IT353_05885 [Gemmatimonadaceae bacterium]|nr:hypothetical protein [Gemmatimonadaceae bacterium]